jgi:hypothetical protein
MRKPTTHQLGGQIRRVVFLLALPGRALHRAAPSAAVLYLFRTDMPPADAQTPNPTRMGNGGERGDIMTEKVGLALCDLQNEPGETKDIALGHLEIVRQLQLIAEQARADLGDDLEQRKGSERRRRSDWDSGHSPFLPAPTQSSTGGARYGLIGP